MKMEREFSATYTSKWWYTGGLLVYPYMICVTMLVVTIICTHKYKLSHMQAIKKIMRYLRHNIPCHLFSKNEWSEA